MSIDNVDIEWDDPRIIWHPVPQVEVGITLDDVLSSLAQEAANIPQTHPNAAADPKLGPLLQRMQDLTSELTSVVSQINQIDPTVLATEVANEPPN